MGKPRAMETDRVKVEFTEEEMRKCLMALQYAVFRLSQEGYPQAAQTLRELNDKLENSKPEWVF